MGQPKTFSHSPELAHVSLLAIGRKLFVLLPGFLLSMILAWLSTVLADFTGTALMGFENSPVSSVMVAVVLGFAIANTLPLPVIFHSGIRFSVKQILRLGIVFLGIRLSVFDVFQLGLVGLPIVLLCVISALIFASWISRKLDLPRKLSTLIAVGTAICGVSAILATGPAIDAEEEDVAYAVAVITIFGLIATLLYPFVAREIFAADTTKAGLFLGTSIHDTSQVTGAGLMYSELFDSPRGLDVATVTKMVRNVLMAFIVPFIAWRYNRNTPASEVRRIAVAQMFPLFVLGFIGMAIIRSIGDAGIESGGNAFGIWGTEQWSNVYGFFKEWAVNFLVVALAGVGLSIRMDVFQGLGLKPFVAGLATALVVGLVSVLTILFLGSFVAF